MWSTAFLTLSLIGSLIIGILLFANQHVVFKGFSAMTCIPSGTVNLCCVKSKFLSNFSQSFRINKNNTINQKTELFAVPLEWFVYTNCKVIHMGKSVVWCDKLHSNTTCQTCEKALLKEHGPIFQPSLQFRESFVSNESPYFAILLFRRYHTAVKNSRQYFYHKMGWRVWLNSNLGSGIETSWAMLGSYYTL